MIGRTAIAAGALLACSAALPGCGDDDDDACRPGLDERDGGCVDAGDGDADGDGDGDADGDADVIIESADDLYASENLVTIELTLPPQSFAALEEDPRTYQPGTLQVGDVVLEDVGVRLKGAGSFRGLDGKASFKIKMDEFVEDQRLFGLRRLTLNNQVQDPSAVHERLGYRFMRAAGVVAPRCNSARVMVNGEYWGLYANVESIDDEFVASQFGTAAGNLYDTDYFVDLIPGAEAAYALETNKDVADRSDLAALIGAVNDPVGAFSENAEPLLDLDAVLRLGAVQAMLADWDGYFGARNNYKLYHDLASDRFVLLPWGIDQTFGSSDSAPYYRGTDYDIYGTDSDRYNGWLFVRCKAEPACLLRYQNAVAAALEVWRSLPLEEELDAMVEQIRDAVESDPWRGEGWHDPGAFDNDVRRVRAFVRGRADVVSAQLQGHLPELCENDVDDDGDGDLDCVDGDCQLPSLLPWQSLCVGQDDSCAGAPLPAEVPETIAVTGILVTAGLAGLGGVTVEALARADGAVLATTTSAADGTYELELATGGAPLAVTIRQSLDGYVTNTVAPPPLVADAPLWIEVLLRPAELEERAAEIGVVLDPSSAIVALRAVDCADIRLFFPDLVVEPAPPDAAELGIFGSPILLNVPAGDLSVSGTFEGRSFGPGEVTSIAGEMISVVLRPGAP